MYVCLCDDIKLSDIDKKISSGLNDPEEIFVEMNISTGCGSCQEMVLGIITDRLDTLKAT